MARTEPPGGGTRLLVLFDIDHTLVDVLPLHVAAYEAVVRDTFGLEVRLNAAAFSGQTTPNILRGLAAHAGVPEAEFEACLPEMVASFTRTLRDRLPDDLRERRLRGVPAVLEDLTRRGHVLGVVTGNPPDVGREVLRRAALLDYFQVLTFGTEATERWRLVALAVEKARPLLNPPLRSEQVVVVGDTPHDVAAGRTYGARTVLVGTGINTPEELAGAGADLFLADFTDTRRACEAIEALAAGRAGEEVRT